MSCTWFQCISITRSHCVFHGCLICKHETASPTQFHLETIRPPSWCCLLALTESIHVGMSCTWCQCFPSQESLWFQLVPDYVSMETALPTQFIWRPSVPPVCAALALTESIHVVIHCTWSDVFHHKESIVFSIGCLICKHENCSPSHNSFGDHPSSSCCCSGTHRINTVVIVHCTWCECNSSQGVIVFQLGCLIM